jgi:hypothetical protein
MRTAVCFCLVLAAGCSPQPTGGQTRIAPRSTSGQTRITPPNKQQARANLIALAEQIGQAALQEDHLRMADLTYPLLVEKLGGRELYVVKLEEVAAETRGQGWRLKKFTVGDPSDLTEAGTEMYAVVPYDMEMSSPAGVPAKLPSFLVAVSQNKGATWTFVDGAGIGVDRSKLKAVLPNFPEDLTLPAIKPGAGQRK